MWTLLKVGGWLVLVVLSVAYTVEWQLGRVKLGQSLADIKTVAAKMYADIIGYFRKSSTGPK